MSETHLSEQRILITGGTGFVGTHLVRHLLELGFTDIHVTAFSSDPSEVSEVLPADHIHEINLTDASATFALFEQIQPTQVYHLAAIAAVSDSFVHAETVIRNNTILQLNVLNALVKHCPGARVLAVSSAEVYGKIDPSELPLTETQPLRPLNPYAVSKVAQDLLSQSYWYAHDLQIIRARPFNHIGEGQVAAFVVPAFAQQIVSVERGDQDSIRVGNLEAIRDFLDVKDVVRAYVILMERGEIGEAYNIASGVGTSIRDILDQLIGAATAPVAVTVDPQRLRPSDSPMTIGDASKLRALGWMPTHELSETVVRILNYWRNHA